MTIPSITAYGSDNEGVSQAFNCNGANLLLFFSTDAATPTYAGSSLTLLGTYGFQWDKIVVHYMKNPPAGSNTIASGASNLTVSAWVALKDVYLTNWPGSAVKNSISSNGSFALNGTAANALTILCGANATSGDPAPATTVNITNVDGTVTTINDVANHYEDKVRITVYKDINPGGGNETYTLSGSASTPTGFAIEIPPVPPPAAPANFSGVAQGTTSVLWSWDDVGTETGYRVLDDSLSPVSSDLAAGTTSWLETNLSPGTNYTRRVQAFNDGGTTNSPEATARTQAPLSATAQVMIFS